MSNGIEIKFRERKNGCRLFQTGGVYEKGKFKATLKELMRCRGIKAELIYSITIQKFDLTFLEIESTSIPTREEENIYPSKLTSIELKALFE